MALLSPADFREHFETDLGDQPLQRLLDDSEKEMTRLSGDPLSVTEHFAGLTRSVFTVRPISAVTSITEIIDDLSTVMAVDDWRIRSGTLLYATADSKALVAEGDARAKFLIVSAYHAIPERWLPLLSAGAKELTMQQTKEITDKQTKSGDRPVGRIMYAKSRRARRKIASHHGASFTS